MCLSITHKSCASHIPIIMHNAYMQVLDSLYALANNSRRVLHKTRHHNWMNYPHMYSRDRRTWDSCRDICCIWYIIVHTRRDVNDYVYNRTQFSSRFYKVAVVYMFSSSFMWQSRNICASLYLTTRLSYATLAKLTTLWHIKINIDWPQNTYRFYTDYKTI